MTAILLLFAVAGAGSLLFWLHRRAIGTPPAPGHLDPAAPLALTTSTPRLEDLCAQVAGANVVICVLDAARRDHLGCYGYPRPTTPSIDIMAQQSLVFDQHYCQYTQTKASTASLFTGQYPSTHLAKRRLPLEQSAFTMAKGLREAGYHTALFGSNMWLSPTWGMGWDFDWLRAPDPMRQAGARSGGTAGGARDMSMYRSPDALVKELRTWLRARPRSPFFAYIHLLPPHAPYGSVSEARNLLGATDPARFWRGRLPFREIRAAEGAFEHDSPRPELIDLYDANLRKADETVQQVIDSLTEAGVFENTLFVLTSDHGETFGEHGYMWHVDCPYDEVIRIPLLLRFPGRNGPRGRVGALTQTIDLLPTIFDLLRLPYPRDSVQGRSLVSLITGEVDEVNAYAFSQTEGQPPCCIVHDLRYSLLLYQGGRLRALYDTDSDPWQTRNVAATLPEETARLAKAFRRFAVEQRYPPLDYLDPNTPAPEIPTPPKLDLSEEARQDLEALGYLR